MSAREIPFWSGLRLGLVLGVALVLTITGCADSPTPIRGTGAEVAPPSGWLEYCDRHKDEPFCVRAGNP
jgi:hypothetical protein